MQREFDRDYVPPAPVPAAPQHEQETVIRTNILVDDVSATAVLDQRDRVRWGPVWAGLITALTTFLLLELLMYSLGWLTVDLTAGNQNQNNDGPWVTAAVVLIAFFLGGWVAGSTSAIRGTIVGLLNGFLVWGLGTVLIFTFSTVGLGSLFGAIGGAVTDFLSLNTIDVGTITADEAGQAIRDSAWWAFLSMALSALACTLGGWAGIKSRPFGKAVART